MLNSFYLNYGKKIFSVLTWVVFGLSLGVTSIVAIAQNSVPGDRTYAVKTNFEKVILASYRVLHKDTDYQIDLTKVRFVESQKVLASKQGGLSLNNLNLQILNTESTIKSIQDPEKKASYVQRYVATLNSINTQLEYEKQTLSGSSGNTAPTPEPMINSQPFVQPNDITTQITTTQETIVTTIDNLITQETASVPILVPTETPPPMQRSLMRMSMTTPTPTQAPSLDVIQADPAIPTAIPTLVPTAPQIPTEAAMPSVEPTLPAPTP